MRAGRARFHYVAREDPGDGHPRTARHTTIMPPRNSAMPSLTLQDRLPGRHLAFTGTPAARTPDHNQHRAININLPAPLDNPLLTLVVTGLTEPTGPPQRCHCHGRE